MNKSDEIKMNIYDEINAKAEKYARLDPVRESARRLTLRNEIWEKEYNSVKIVNGKALFPPLKQKKVIDKFEFIDVFNEVVPESIEKFDPNKGATYTTYLCNLLNLRLIDAFKKRIKKENKEISNYDDNEIDIFDTIEAEPIIPFDKEPTEFERFCQVARLVVLQKQKETHLGKSGRLYFEGFFTFDATEQTKKDFFDKKEVIAENETLFPIMESVVLKYLLEGEIFSHMRDVVAAPVKDDKLLEQRNETMQVCYNLSKPTVVKKNKSYRELWNSVKG